MTHMTPRRLRDWRRRYLYTDVVTFELGLADEVQSLAQQCGLRLTQYRRTGPMPCQSHHGRRGVSLLRRSWSRCARVLVEEVLVARRA